MIKITKFSVNKKYVLFIVEVGQIEIKCSRGHHGKWTRSFVHTGDYSIGEGNTIYDLRKIFVRGFSYFSL